MARRTPSPGRAPLRRDEVTVMLDLDVLAELELRRDDVPSTRS
jgi:hypothetical protein